jgi:hypothetical protein
LYSHLRHRGRTCNSVAAKDQKYCPHHLRYRARQLRLAQARARADCFDVKLPPLEDMYAVQSALAQIAEKLKQAGIAPADSEPKDFDTRVAEEMKKVAAHEAEVDAYLAGQEVKMA